MRISDWSSDVCSSDLVQLQGVRRLAADPSSATQEGNHRRPFFFIGAARQVGVTPGHDRLLRYRVQPERGSKPITTPSDRMESASLDALVRSSRKNGSLALRGGGGSTVGDTMQVASAGWQSLGAAPVHRILPSTAQSNRPRRRVRLRSEEHTSELKSLMRNSTAVFCLKK